jgi:hypothetical protein
MALLLKWSTHAATRRQTQPIFAAFLLMITAVCYVREARAVPVYLREARANGQARMDYDRRLAAVLHSLPSQATVLAYTGAHAGAFELADFHLDRTVNEGIHFVWDAALQNPAQVADYVIAEHGDPVSEAVRRHPKNLLPVATIAVPGQSAAVVYRSASR